LGIKREEGRGKRDGRRGVGLQLACMTNEPTSKSGSGGADSEAGEPVIDASLGASKDMSTFEGPEAEVQVTVLETWAHNARTLSHISCTLTGHRTQDTRTQDTGYKDTGHKDTRTQGHKDTGHKGTRTQGHKDTRTQGHRTQEP
jgi:hypothetical protein